MAPANGGGGDAIITGGGGTYTRDVEAQAENNRITTRAPAVVNIVFMTFSLIMKPYPIDLCLWRKFSRPPAFNPTFADGG